MNHHPVGFPRIFLAPLLLFISIYGFAQSAKLGVGAPGSDFIKDAETSKQFYEHRFKPKYKTATAYSSEGKPFKLKPDDIIALAEADKGSWNGRKGIWIKFFTVNSSIHAPANDTHAYVLLSDMDGIESQFPHETHQPQVDPVSPGTYRLRQIVVFGTLILILVLVIFILIRRSRRKAAAIAAYKDRAKRGQNFVFAEFERLGSSQQQREIAINGIFEQRNAVLRYGYTTSPHAGDAVRIARSVMTMDAREREFLRAAMLLFNENAISKDEYRYFLFAFLNGDGKATIDTTRDYLDVFSGETANVEKVEEQLKTMDAKVSSAVNRILQVLADPARRVQHPALFAEINARITGGTGWLKADETATSVFGGDSPFGLDMGYLEPGGKLLRYAGDGSLITIAPPGSGKTQCLVLPNMLQWKGAALVLDVKGEIYEATHNWRRANIGPVYKFSPLDPVNSQCYNPLAFVRKEPDFIWEDARLLADMMIVPRPSNDPFWDVTARDVLTAGIAYLCDDPSQEPTMSRLIDLMYGMDLSDVVLTLKASFRVSAMQQMGFAIEKMDPKTLGSVLSTIQSHLSTWQGERIKRVTQTADWSPLALRNEQATIYLCINPSEIDSYLSLLRVFIAQHIRMLVGTLPKRDAAPVLFMLDEFPRLKSMPPIDEALNVGRQYGIKLWMFAQSYGQLKESYPNADGMLNSCAVRTFMNMPLSDEFTHKLASQLGHSEGPFDNARKQLVEAADLAGPAYADKILVLATNTKPVQVYKHYAYKDDSLQAKMR